MGANKANPPASLPEHIVQIRADWLEQLRQLKRLHDEGASGQRIVTSLSDYRDQIITQIFQRAIAEAHTAGLSSHTAVVMHGGCGRRDVAPYSDVDLMLLCQSERQAGVPELARMLSQSVNDIGFRLGFSVQNPRSACTLAQHQAETFSSFIDSRFLVGNIDLFDAFFSRFQRLSQRRSLTAIREILRARETERQEFGDTVYLLRPDIKRSSGGLRDLHLVRWVGFLKHGEVDFERLVELGALTAWDTTRLNSAHEFLLRLRNELHFAAGSANDRLTKSEQIRIADKLKVPGKDGVFPVEVFMREYFSHTSDVRYCSDHFVSASLYRGGGSWTPLVTKTIQGKFRVGLFQIGVRPNLLSEVAGDLEQVLRLMQLAAMYNKEIEHPTWQAIREAMVHTPPGELDPNCAAHFMALLAGTTRLGMMLRRLHELRALERVLPGFQHARCLLQFNEYHQYTVDEHSIRAVERATEFHGDSGRLGQAYREIRQKELLHLALLLHDLGKGYAEDHSEVGRRMALETVDRLGLPREQGEIVAHLVHKHLQMDHIATRRDINDESIVAEFCSMVGSIDVLRMLYVMTCADIAAVGPGVLNDWKRGLLTDLYRNAKSFMTGHQGPQAVDEKLGNLYENVRTNVEDREAAEWVVAHAQTLPRNYCRQHAPETIAQQLLEIRQLRRGDFRCWVSYSEKRRSVEVCVAKHQQRLAGIFYQMNGMLASLGLRIHGADIKPLDDSLIWYWFQFGDPTFSGPPPASRLEQIRQLTDDVVGGARSEAPRIPKTWQIADEALPELTPEIRVQIDNQSVEHATIIDVFAYQKLGLLYEVSKKIFEFGLDVHFARTSVYGPRIVCVFYVTDESRSKIRDVRRLVKIRRGLLNVTKEFLLGPQPPRAIGDSGELTALG